MAAPSLNDYPARPTVAGQAPISVVTTVRNGAATLERAIASVRQQNIPGLDYVIADAGSTDGTLDIIRANADLVNYWQSERDKGISDGFNKGIALSTGKYVAILNSDDWLSPGQLAAGIDTLDRTGADFVFGDMLYHAADGAPAYFMRGEADYARRIRHVMPALNHPTVIVRRSVYERFGLFDLTLRYAMDYEFLLRVHHHGAHGVYDPRILGHMALEGASDIHSRRALAEVRDVAIRYGGAPAREWARFIFRAVKADLRRVLERYLPAPVVAQLRRKANRNYAGLAS